MDPSCVTVPLAGHQLPVQGITHLPQTNSPSEPLGTSHFDMCNMFMAGYSDCAQEALRYLTEEEGLPLNHPMVTGLLEHLRVQQWLLYTQYCLRTNTMQYSGEAKADCKLQTSRDNLEYTCSEFRQDSNIHTGDTDNKTKVKLEISSSVNACDNSNNSRGNTENTSSSEETDKLAVEIAEELFCLLQNDGFLSESDEDDSEDDRIEDFMDS